MTKTAIQYRQSGVDIDIGSNARRIRGISNKPVAMDAPGDLHGNTQARSS